MITWSKRSCQACSAEWPRRTTTQTRAVLLDALGTLVDLEPPWVPLAKVARDRGCGRGRARREDRDGLLPEHSHEGKDAESLQALRVRCADILSWELDREVPLETMLDAFRFRAFDDARPALDELRKAGMRLVCVSNWDISLSEVLERCGLADAIDGIVTSAGSGQPKAGSGDLRRRLSSSRAAGADEALHVGDTVAEDIAGADAAGIRALHLDRSGGGDISSLAEVLPSGERWLNTARVGPRLRAGPTLESARARCRRSEAPWSPLRGQRTRCIGLGAISPGAHGERGHRPRASSSGEPAQTLVALVPQGILFLGVPIAIAASRVSSRPWRVVGFVPFKPADLWLVAAAMGAADRGHA